MISYRIIIEGFADDEPRVELDFRGEPQKGNADLKQVLDIANELKIALNKFQRINLALEETD